MNNPIISVIVPVYNIKPKFLRQCFDSIVGQTLADFELIIVNDASTTHCFDVCKEYADKDERIVLIDKKQNEGVDRARFSGMERARGKYVAFVDADDWLCDREIFSKLYNKAEETGADLVQFRWQRVYNSHSLIKLSSASPLSGLIEQPEMKERCWASLFCYSGGLFPASMCGKLFRREAIERAHLQPTGAKQGEDTMFILALWPHLRSAYFMDDIGYTVRVRYKKDRVLRWFFESAKMSFNMRLRLIEEYNFHRMHDEARITFLNGFKEEIAQRIRFTHTDAGCRVA